MASRFAQLGGRRKRAREQRLAEYIRITSSLGYDKEAIRDRLLKDGWRANQINKYLAPKPDVKLVNYLLLFLFLAASFAIVAFFKPAMFGATTGIFGETWENSTEIIANSSVEFVTSHIVFGEYKPKSCAEGIYVEANSQIISFQTQNEIYNEQNLCTEADVVFDNIIYGQPEKKPIFTIMSSTVAGTSEEITYNIYYGKLPAAQAERPLVEEQPAPEVLPEESNVSLESVLPESTYIKFDQETYYTPPGTLFTAKVKVKNPAKAFKTLDLVPAFDERLNIVRVSEVAKNKSGLDVQGASELNLKNDFELEKHPSYNSIDDKLKVPKKLSGFDVKTLAFASDFQANEEKEFEITFKVPDQATSGEFFFYALGDGIGLGVDPWWNTSWGYRKQLNISNTGSALTNYQVNLSIDTQTLVSAGKLQSDCDDLRFTNSSDSSIDYWIESGCNTTATAIWVEVPTVSASTNTSIWMYYGNSGASAGSNGTLTFDYFDDFDDNNIADWTTSGTVTVASGIVSLDRSATTDATMNHSFSASSPFIEEAKYRHTNTQPYRNRLYLTTAASVGSPTGYDYGLFDNGETYIYWNGWDTSLNVVENTWYIIKWENTASNYIWNILSSARAVLKSKSHGSAIASLARLQFSATEADASGFGLDWVLVRKYASTPPTYTTGSEESNGDTTSPTVTLSLPADASTDSDGNITFECNTTDNIGLANVTLYGNWTGTWHANQTSTISGTSNSSQFNVTGLIHSTNVWNCLAYDNSSNSAWGASNWTVTVSNNVPTTPTLSSPTNATTTTTTPTFDWSDSTDADNDAVKYELLLATDANFDNITYWASDVWLNQSFAHRKQINISNTGSALTDYQVNLSVDTQTLIDAGKLQSDCDDIKFTNSTGTSIDYWIESGCDTTATVIWVEVPTISASTNTSIWMYYGNSSVSAGSNGVNTFLWYDDFSTNTTANYSLYNTVSYDDTNDWIVLGTDASGGTGQIQKDASWADGEWVGKVQLPGTYTSLWSQGSMVFRSSGNMRSSPSYAYSPSVCDGSSCANTTRFERYANASSYLITTSALTVSRSTWYWTKVKAVGTSIKIRAWQAGTTEPSTWNIDTTDANIASGGAGFYCWDKQVYVDDLRVRKASATEPTISATGSEQNYTSKTDLSSSTYTTTAAEALTSGTTYYWKARAYDNQSTPGYSSWATYWQFTTSSSAITACTNITSAGTYTLQNSISNSAATACINISASDVTFDGQEFTIDGVDTANTQGVYVSGASTLTNVTVKDVTVTDWAWGIYYYQTVENSSISNTNGSSNYWAGLDLQYANNNNLTNNIANDNSAYGIHLYNADSNTLTNNTANTNPSHGFYIEYSDSNTLTNNTANSNTQYGIALNSANSNVFTSNNASSNTVYDIYIGNSQSNTFTNQTFAAGTSYETKAIFTYSGDMRLKGVTSPPADPSGNQNISKYVNATNYSAGAWLQLNISYTAADIGSLVESGLKMRRNNGSWELVPTNFASSYGVDTTNNYVYANLTGFGSTFAPLGNKAPSAPTLQSPANGSTVLTTRLPTLNFSIPADADDDTLHFEVFISNSSDFAYTTEYGNSSASTTGFSPAPPVAQNSGDMNYTLQKKLNATTYFWKARAFDSYAYSSWSGIFNFTIGSIILDCAIGNSDITFGTVNPSTTNNASDNYAGAGSGTKYNVTVDASVQSNITIYGTNLSCSTGYCAGQNISISNLKWASSETSATDASMIYANSHATQETEDTTNKVGDYILQDATVWTRYWLVAPSSQTAGNYNGTYTLTCAAS